MEQHEEAEDELEAGESEGAARGAGSFAAGVVVGALIGAGIAILFAPDAGVRTRRRLRRGAEALRARAGAGLDEAAKRTRKDLMKRRRRLEKQLERLTAEARGRIADLR
jgi:gas vesicle protein